LSDLQIVVRKGLAAFDINLNDSHSNKNDNGELNSKEFVKIPVHKLVLSARCSYFFAQFCKAEWGDKNQSEAQFLQFSE